MWCLMLLLTIAALLGHPGVAANAAAPRITGPGARRLTSAAVANDPTISPVNGEYEDSTGVEIFSKYAEKIFYTLNGTEPTAASTEYLGRFQLSTPGTTTVKAVAVYDDGASLTAVTSVTYVAGAYTRPLLAQPGPFLTKNAPPIYSPCP
jgi:hypothetical protein